MRLLGLIRGFGAQGFGVSGLGFVGAWDSRFGF